MAERPDFNCLIGTHIELMRIDEEYGKGQFPQVSFAKTKAQQVLRLTMQRVFIGIPLLEWGQIHTH